LKLIDFTISNLADLGLLFLLRHYLNLVAAKSNSKRLLQVMGRLIFIKLANWWRVCVLKSNLADLGLLFLLRRYLYLVATKSNSKRLLQVMGRLIFIKLAN